MAKLPRLTGMQAVKPHLDRLISIERIWTKRYAISNRGRWSLIERCGLIRTRGAAAQSPAASRAAVACRTSPQKVL